MSLPSNESTASGRIDCWDVIGDITGATSGAVCMAATSSSDKCYLYRWELAKGASKWIANSTWGTISKEITETYPSGQTTWGGGATINIINDELFYVDGSYTYPTLYNTSLKIVESFASATNLAPDKGCNGIDEFTIKENKYIAYAETQYIITPGCRVNICQLGENRSFEGMRHLWSVPETGLGNVSDAGTRIHSIDTYKVSDKNGKEGVYLLTYKVKNGFGLYFIAEKGFGEEILVDSIEFEYETVAIKPNETLQLHPQITPENLALKLSWTSAYDSVATVTPDGLVTAVSEGTTQIIATTTDGSKSDTCIFSVIPSDYYCDFIVNNIAYKKSDNNIDVHVVPCSKNSNIIIYNSPILEIPKTVKFNSKTYNVTGIEEKAFYENTNLTSITIPESVTSIGDNAFSECSGLTIVNFNATNCTTMGSTSFPVFKNCTKLVTLNIGKNVTNIPNYAFSGCSGLTSVTIPESVTSIGDNAFSECSSLTIVNFNATNCTTMGSTSFPVFKNCTKLVTLNIGKNVTNIPNYAFSGCSGLTSVTIPESVTSIGDNAFSECSGLILVAIPESVTSIGHGTFDDCNNLLYMTLLGETPPAMPSGFISDRKDFIIVVPTGCVDIYKNDPNWSQFTKIYEMSDLDIDNKYLNFKQTSNGRCYLSSCEKTASGKIEIPKIVIIDGIICVVTSIAIEAFKDCSGLTSVTIPNSVTEIGNNTFNGCSGLTSVTIPNSVTEIGYMAFYGCSGLTSMTIPNSVTEIGNMAFYGCMNLDELIIEDGKETLSLGYNYYYSEYSEGNGLFSDCPLIELYLGRNLDYDTSESFGYSPFKRKTTLKMITIGNSVTEIGDYAFYYCTGLTSVTIPNSVTRIGNMAFYGCTNLYELIIEDGKETLSLGYNYYGPYSSVSQGLFSDCPLIKLYLGRNLDYDTSKSLGYSPFYKKTTLKMITIGNSVTSINDYAFNDCTGLTEVNISDLSAWYKIDFANEYANPLYYAGHLKLNGTEITNLVIPDNITEIKAYAFIGCSGLRSVTIGNSVTSIREGAFYDCTGLTEVNISDLSAWCKIEFGTDSANPLFYAGHLKLNGTEITNLVIPDNITEIKAYAFIGCSGLTSVTIPNSVTRIGNMAFYDCDGLTSINIPNSVTSIGSSAFYSCTGLTSVTIPNSVKSIGNYTFYNCTGLTSVTIPNSVTYIGAGAFSGSGLRLIFSYCMTPPACEDGAFNGCYAARLMVPEGTYYDYLVANEWYKFDKIQEFAGVGVEGIEFDEDAVEVTRYDIYGRQLTEPTKGVNIIKMSDGSTRKEYVK